MGELSEAMEHLVSANAAAFGGVLATTVTFPIDTVNKKIVNAPEGEKSIGAVVKKVLDTDGVGGFFSGLNSKLIWSYGGKFIFYGTYSILKTWYQSIMGQPFTFAHDLIAGYICEWATTPVAVPFEAIATRLQSSKGGMMAAITDTLSEKGFFGLYSGLSAYYILCVTPAITNTIFSQIKEMVLSGRTSKVAALTTGEAFVYGGLARAISTMLMYPFLMAKTVLQSAKKKKGDEPAGPELSAVGVIMDVIKKQGFLACYSGLSTELTRGVISQAVTMMFKERIYVIIRALVLTMAKKNAAAAIAAA